MSALPFTDWRGNAVDVGTKVLYAKTFGSAATELVEGVVVEGTPKGIKVQRERSSRGGTRWWTERPVVLTNLANVTAL